jgi:DNA repair exonuclease SbcCD ATPase subunit
MEQQNLAHYKEIASTYEAQLKETSKAYDEFRAQNEAQVQALINEKERSTKRVAELEGLVQQYQNEQEALEKKLREQISATETAKRNTESVEQQLKGMLAILAHCSFLFTLH